MSCELPASSMMVVRPSRFMVEFFIFVLVERADRKGGKFTRVNALER
jgi:hypothetical protein